MQKVESENPNVEKKSYIESEAGAKYIELQFILYFLERFTADYSSAEKEKLIEDLIKEITKDDSEKKERLLEIYKTGQLGYNISKTVLQIIRLSVGKGVFMNTAVKVTNIVLRFIIGKGMSYGRNAVFRQVLVKFFGSPNIILVIISLLPDLFSLVNPRNYLGLTNTIILLYLMRNKDLIT